MTTILFPFGPYPASTFYFQMTEVALFVFSLGDMLKNVDGILYPVCTWLLSNSLVCPSCAPLRLRALETMQ